MVTTNLLLETNVTDAILEYAKAIGKEPIELTTEEKKKAFLNHLVNTPLCFGARAQPPDTPDFFERADSPRDRG